MAEREAVSHPAPVKGRTPASGQASIHPTAIVEEGASVGSGTRIWHFCHIRSGAVIGDRCMLGKGVFVDQGAKVGNDVRVQNHVSVYSGVELRDEVFVGPGVVFTNDRVPRASGDWTLDRIVVGQGASIGGNATVIAGVQIGSWALVGAGSVVTRDVRSHQVVAGNPAKPMGWICRCGATRVPLDATSLSCEECGTDEETRS